MLLQLLEERKGTFLIYRISKLAQILKDSLGDKSKVLMVVHVSPYKEDVGETTCSCTFAKRARAAECNRELSEAIFSFLCFFILSLTTLWLILIYCFASL